MNNQRNYYQILHVQPDAPTEVIRSSYRTMMQRLKMHPDLGGDQEAAALANEAYAVLSNPTKRAQYDAKLHANTDFEQGKGAASTSSDKTSSAATVSRQELDITERCPFCQTQHDFGKYLQPDSVCAVCDSALFPAIKQNFEGGDQRIIQRINKQWPITFYTQWPNSKSYVGQTQDVSLNGMQVLTKIALHEGQIVKITSSTLDALARVVNQREFRSGLRKQWRIGLEFLTLRFHQVQGTFLKLDA